MTSILTNTSATIALQTLRSINQQLDTTSNRVSTGQRITSAADGAAYWAIASTLKSDNGSLSALKDAMSLDKNSIDAASAGLNKVIDQLTAIKNALTSATSEQADKSKLQNDIKVALNAIQTYSDNTVMNGSNWLTVKSDATGFSATKNLVAAYSRVGATVSVSKTQLDTSAFILFDNAATASGTAASTTAMTTIASASTFTDVTVAAPTATTGQKGFMDTAYTLTGVGVTVPATVSLKTIDITTANQATISTYLKIVDATTQQLLTGASKLGSMSTLLKSQSDFTQQLMDINTSSIGSLVDANIEEESTKLKALQTQQQLGIQSLSIANSSSQNVLSLFR
ncbi:flagellin [Methylobacterium komagatae]|uniref:Flagellin n=1 Tax=Methylobacterium komagatae TaxID=374425 RepID=A0ABW2BKF9_9HYPH